MSWQVIWVVFLEHLFDTLSLYQWYQIFMDSNSCRSKCCQQKAAVMINILSLGYCICLTWRDIWHVTMLTWHLVTSCQCQMPQNSYHKHSHKLSRLFVSRRLEILEPWFQRWTQVRTMLFSWLSFWRRHDEHAEIH